MTESSRKYIGSFPACLFISTVLTAVPFFVMKIYYLYGDDYLLNYIANGSYGNEYSDHLVFPQMIVGTLLKNLYGITRRVNWYAVMLAVTFALAFAVWHYVLMRFSRNEMALIISLFINAIAVPFMFTFTVAAFFAAGAGACLLYLSYYEERPLRYIVFGVILMIWGYNLRTDTLVPAMCLMGPLALEALITLIKAPAEVRRRYIRKVGMLFAAAVISAFCLFALSRWERAAYGGKEWQEYNAYNYARAQTLDYPMLGYETLREGYEEIGVTPEEYFLLSTWSFGEKDVFTEKMFLEMGMVQANYYTRDFRLAYTKSSLTGRQGMTLILIPLALLLVFFFLDPGFHAVTALLQVGCLVLIYAALCYIRMRFLMRVAMPLCVISTYVILLSTRRSLGDIMPEKRRAAIRFIGAAAGLAMLCAAMVFFKRSFDSSVSGLRNPKIKESSQAALDEVRSHPEITYLADSYAFSRMYYYGHPISDITTVDDYRHLVRAGSWDTYSPRYYRMAETVGVSDPDNLLTSLLEDDDYYLISNSQIPVLEFLESYTGRKIAADVEDIGDGFLKKIRFRYA